MGVSARLSPREGRKFAFTVGIAFLVLTALSAWRGHYYPPRVMGALGIVLLLAGIVAPGSLGPVQTRWMQLAHAISKVTAPIVVGALYFGVITPIGWLMRVLGKNPLRHDARDGGFWMTAPSGGRSDLHNQF